MGVNKIIDLSKERALRNLEYLDEYCFLYVEEFCFLLNWDINDFPILLKTLGVQASGMQSTDFECKFDLISEKSEKIYLPSDLTALVCFFWNLLAAISITLR